MDLNIKHPRYSTTELGGFFKESKIRYLWEFMLDNVQRTIELQHSRITCKRKIFFDGKEILKVHKFTYDFSYSFAIDKHYISLIQLSPTNYDLRIDNIGFKTIIEYATRDKFVKKENDEYNKVEQKDYDEDKKIESKSSIKVNEKDKNKDKDKKDYFDKKNKENFNDFNDKDFDFGVKEEVKDNKDIMNLFNF